MTNPTLHELKAHPQYFKKLISGEKTFEIRKNDRNFQVGDILELQEWNPDNLEYTGKSTKRIVTYIIWGDATESIFPLPGYCIMGVKAPPATQQEIDELYKAYHKELPAMKKDPLEALAEKAKNLTASMEQGDFGVEYSDATPLSTIESRLLWLRSSLDSLHQFRQERQELFDMPNLHEQRAASEALFKRFQELGTSRCIDSLTMEEFGRIAHTALFAAHLYNKEKKNER